MSDLETRLEEIFVSDSRARRVDRVHVASPRWDFVGGAALTAAVALAAVAAIVAFNTLRPPLEQPAAAPSAVPTFGATPSPSTAPQSPAPTPLGASYGNATHGYAVSLPAPYHLSSKFTTPQFVDANGVALAHPAAQDVFTVLTREQEDAGTVNCHTACPTWNYTVFVVIYTDGGDLTAREAYQAGPIGFAGKSAASKLEDVKIDGHDALKIEPGASGDLVQYIVPDGAGRIFVLSAVVYLPSQAAVPAGASEQKLRSILDSFRLTTPSAATPKCSVAAHGELRACPADATVGQTITLAGTGCGYPGAQAILYFGTTDQFGQPTQGTYGAVEIGRFDMDANGRFATIVTIPSQLQTIQGQGGGPVKSGLYAIYSKPDFCRTYITVH
jgi:hypothetical protein